MKFVKDPLIHKQNQWVAEHDTEELYRRYPHVYLVRRILDCTRDVHGRVLDVGCFDGYVAAQIAAQGGKDVYGVDRLERALDLAAARGIRTVSCDFEDDCLPFPDGDFDCVVIGSTLQYVFDPEHIIKESRRVLKSAGRLIVTVPNLASIWNRARMLIGSPPLYLDTHPRQGGYSRYFTLTTLRKLLEDQRFRVEATEANVVALPWFRLPGLRRRYPGLEWERHRLCSSRTLARPFPTIGENIALCATKLDGDDEDPAKTAERCPALAESG